MQAWDIWPEPWRQNIPQARQPNTTPLVPSSQEELEAVRINSIRFNAVRKQAELLEQQRKLGRLAMQEKVIEEVTERRRRNRGRSNG